MRPRNEELYNSIVDAAIRLFIEQGYTNTFYKDIADAVGVKRTVIQHYFPKKELLAKVFMEDTGKIVEDYVDQKGYATDDAYVTKYVYTQFGFGFLSFEEGASKFFYDVLEDRKLTLEVLFGDSMGLLEKIGYDPSKHGEDILDASTKHLGGFLMLLYRRVYYKRPLNISSMVLDLMVEQAELYGDIPDHAIKHLELAAYSDNVLRQAAADIRVLCEK